MEKADVLIKGFPDAFMKMFRGFCAIEGKTESEGVIDVVIDYIEKNTNGKNENFKKLVAEYRGDANPKKKK